MTLNQIKKIIHKNLSIIQEKYRVKKIGIFGSYATGEQHTSSDIDILVELNRPVGLLKFTGLKFFLEDKLNMKVDLATKNGLKPLIKDEILSEAIYL